MNKDLKVPRAREYWRSSITSSTQKGFARPARKRSWRWLTSRKPLSITTSKARTPLSSLTSRSAIAPFGTSCQHPQACARFWSSSNHRPTVPRSSAALLRIASEYPDPSHPFHQLAIEHQNKIRDCLASLLDTSVSDKKAAAAALLSIIDGALTLRMLYGTSKEIRLVSLAEAVLKSFS